MFKFIAKKCDIGTKALMLSLFDTEAFAI